MGIAGINLVSIRGIRSMALLRRFVNYRLNARFPDEDEE
jgi:hypothetical protein